LERYSCRDCNQQTKCCPSYEFCVSCCLDPAKDARTKIDIMNVARKAGFNTDIHDEFDICSFLCRTSSHSIDQLNFYTTENEKHCYVLKSEETS